jgi:hypothetical protein
MAWLDRRRKGSSFLRIAPIRKDMTIVKVFGKPLHSLDNDVHALTIQERIAALGYIPEVVDVKPTRLYVVGRNERNRLDCIVIEFDYNYRESKGEVRFSPDIDREKQEKIMEELYKPI